MDDSNEPNPSASATDGSGAGLPESILNTDTMFEALAHERRRYLLYTLLEDEGWSLRRLAGKVAAWEEGCAEPDLSEERIERVYASLHHAHVPKLADLEIIEYDRRDETIARGPAAKPVLDVLEQVGASTAVELEQHARKEKDD